MLYTDFQGKKISQLGFGTMRLPLREDKQIDEDLFLKMVDMAIENGVNYFDTAAPYHGGMSEVVTGKALSRYPRGSYFLADKYPGHQIVTHYDPAATFEQQLRKCGVEYFDFYLLHNVCENSLSAYEDSRWNIIPYFIEQRRQGRIHHLGFSSHGQPEMLEYFLAKYGQDMEFCQIQLNYLDWTLQEAQKKVEILNGYGVPIWVMEPVHGGLLADLKEKNTSLKTLRPDESIASWAFRWVQTIPNVKVILSGMSTPDQMVDNLKTFSGGTPLSVSESEKLMEIADELKDALPCTSCRYCCDGCPAGLNIPKLIHAYNDAKLASGFTVSMYLDTLPEDKKPSACIGCGACSQICPQKIDIPQAMKDFAALIPKLPSWSAICKEREEAAKKFE